MSKNLLNNKILNYLDTIDTFAKGAYRSNYYDIRFYMRIGGAIIETCLDLKTSDVYINVAFIIPKLDSLFNRGVHKFINNPASPYCRELFKYDGESSTVVDEYLKDIGSKELVLLIKSMSALSDMSDYGAAFDAMVSIFEDRYDSRNAAIKSLLNKEEYEIYLYCFKRKE